MAFKIPHAGLQLEEDYNDSADLPTQAFLLDLSDSVIDDMIESVNQGHEIRLALGKTPTFLYGPSSHHIEPAAEDGNDDLELFLSSSLSKAERLPQFAMSLFRKPELGDPWEQYRAGSSEDEDDEYEEDADSPEPEDVSDQQSYNALNTDIALLRNSLAQKEAEKLEKSAKVIEGSSTVPTGKTASKRVGSLQKALSGRRSPFNRASPSPLPGSPSLSAIGSPSLTPNDAASQQAVDKAKQTRLPIIHELAFQEQPYDLLWQKYPACYSEAEFKTALEKVADIDEETQNYTLRKKYWKELDVWNHEYASNDERQQAIDNAVRQYDKMRLSQSDPEWEKLLPKEERGKGRILSKIYSAISKGPPPPKSKSQRTDDSGGDLGSGRRSSSRDDSGDNGNGSNRTDEDGMDSESVVVSSQKGPSAGKKKVTAQEKRLLSTKKKSTTTSSATSQPSSTRPSPTKPSAKASNEKQTKFKSKEFITDSDSTDSESESAPLSTTVHQSKLAAANTKPLATMAAKMVSKAASSTSAGSTVGDKARKASAAPAVEARKSKPLPPAKEVIKSQITAKPLPKKRVREDEDDSSSSSSSGTPLSKRIKPLKPTAAKPALAKERDKYQQPRQQRPPPPPLRASNNVGSSNGPGSGASANGNKPRSSSSNNNSNNSPTKSSPLASSPPTNASELDVSSEESVPPISTSNTSQKRKLADERRNNFGTESSSGNNVKAKKRKHLPDDVVQQARRFKVVYEKYETLYRDIASRANPPKEKVGTLLAMHHQLQEMKKNIYSETMMRA